PATEPQTDPGRVNPGVASMRETGCRLTPVVAAYRLHLGVDARDVAEAHRLAPENDGDAFERYVVSGSTPVDPRACHALQDDPAPVIEQRAPALARVFRARGWSLPDAVDRIYDSRLAERRLGWKAAYGFEE